jgi:hypothetical protein
VIRTFFDAGPIAQGARLDAVGFELSRPLVPPSDRARSLAVNLRIEIFLAECSALGLAHAAP